MKKRILTVRLFILFGLIGATVLSVRMLDQGRAGILLKLLEATNVTFQTLPTVFSPFHLCFLFLCVLLTVFAVLFALRAPNAFFERWTDPIVFSFGVVFWFMETYKQTFSFFILGSGRYDFALFPFQFCSLPIYFCLLIPLLPKGNIKNLGYRFLALFGTVGGMAVILFPSFSDHVTISVHTLVWHALMVLLGFFLLVASDCGKDLRREFLSSSGLFLILLTAATVVNLLCSEFDGFNMFYLSPFYNTHFWLLSDIQRTLGWSASVLLYAAAFLFLGALPTWWIGKKLTKARENRGKHGKN